MVEEAVEERRRGGEVAEDEGAYEDRTEYMVQVPVEFRPAVRELSAKHKR